MKDIYQIHKIHMLTVSITLLAATLIISGCAVKLISNYDETTDKAITALHKKTEMHLVGLEVIEDLPECKYENQKKFYEEVKVDVSAIAVRAAAISKNEITVDQTTLLSKSLESLESLHKIACLSKNQIAPLRTQFNTIFTAILKLEIAKRRDE